MRPNFLFPPISENRRFSFLTLALRLFFGLLLFVKYGLYKWINFQELLPRIPDFLGMGRPMSMSLAIFAQVFCIWGVIAGFLYRLSLIPVLISMVVALYVAFGISHEMVELAALYLGVLVLLFIVGPGKYSIDYLIQKRHQAKRRSSSK